MMVTEALKSAISDETKSSKQNNKKLDERQEHEVEYEVCVICSYQDALALPPAAKPSHIQHDYKANHPPIGL